MRLYEAYATSRERREPVTLENRAFPRWTVTITADPTGEAVYTYKGKSVDIRSPLTDEGATAKMISAMLQSEEWSPAN